MQLKLFYLLFIAALTGSCSSAGKLIQKKTLSYPSASGIEFLHNNYYVIGDDATSLAILNNRLSVTDSIKVSNYEGYRIPKSVKPDFEAIAISGDEKLWLIGSGSSTKRNECLIIDPEKKSMVNLSLQTLYSNLKTAGIKEINIEGASFSHQYLLLANRGNYGYPKNYLIAVDTISINKTNTRFHIAEISLPVNSNSFIGISGLFYHKEQDMLICTASTEETTNSIDDGAIGKSYLLFINKITKKLNGATIIPDKIIDLETVNNQFKGQKIESVCKTKEGAKMLHIVLTADNDNGSSNLFRLRLKKD